MTTCSKCGLETGQIPCPCASSPLMIEVLQDPTTGRLYEIYFPSEQHPVLLGLREPGQMPIAARWRWNNRPVFACLPAFAAEVKLEDV